MNVTVSELYFSYRKRHPVLIDITLYLNQDMFPVAIVGPNGSGKSTLLKNMSGIYKPDKGSVIIGNKNIHSLSGMERANLVGVLFPDSVYPASISVMDVVLSGLYRYMRLSIGYPKHLVEKAFDVMKKLNIDYLRDRQFNHLSSGERQLVLIAMVMLQNPQVILLDEPTSFLDPIHKYMLLEVLSVLSGSHGLIFSSHDIEFIRAISRFVVGIKNGKIVFKGKTSKFFEQGFEMVFGMPYSRYVSVLGL